MYQRFSEVTKAIKKKKKRNEKASQSKEEFIGF